MKRPDGVGGEARLQVRRVDQPAIRLAVRRGSMPRPRRRPGVCNRGAQRAPLPRCVVLPHTSCASFCGGFWPWPCCSGILA